MGSCWAVLVWSSAPGATGAAEAYLLEEDGKVALPGDGLEVFEERVAAGSAGIGAVCDWVDLRPSV